MFISILLRTDTESAARSGKAAGSFMGLFIIFILLSMSVKAFVTNLRSPVLPHWLVFVGMVCPPALGIILNVGKWMGLFNLAELVPKKRRNRHRNRSLGNVCNCFTSICRQTQ